MDKETNMKGNIKDRPNFVDLNLDVDVQNLILVLCYNQFKALDEVPDLQIGSYIWPPSGLFYRWPILTFYQ